jgi:hypothetical protein
MSLNLTLGDFVATASLAHQLYKDIYLVARGAPEELKLLKSEIGVLALSIDLLTQEVKEENSTLVRAGETRMRMVEEVLTQANATLKELEVFAKKHDFTALGSKEKGKRIWDRVKFSLEVKSVDAMRTKITRHNTTMNLLLTSAGKCVAPSSIFTIALMMA